MNNHTTTTESTPKTKGLHERILLISNAWTHGAPETSFSSLTHAEFLARVEPFETAHDDLKAILIGQRGKVAQKNAADRATRLVLDKVIAAVKASDDHGPESSFYRAMGFVPPSERKSPAKAGSPVPTSAAIRLMERLNRVTAAWLEFAPGQKFANLTLEQFKTATHPSFAIRETMASDESNRKGAVGTRNLAEKQARGLVKMIVNAVRGNESFGANSALYRAMGFIPENERKSPARKPRSASGSPVEPKAV